MLSIGHENMCFIMPNNIMLLTTFLKNVVKHPQILVGDFIYYDDPDDVSNFEKNVLYLFDLINDNLFAVYLGSCDFTG